MNVCVLRVQIFNKASLFRDELADAKILSFIYMDVSLAFAKYSEMAKNYDQTSGNQLHFPCAFTT